MENSRYIHLCHLRNKRISKSETTKREEMNEKKPFYTEKFYTDDFTIVGILNELQDGNLITNKDTYSSGALLFLDIRDCPESRNLLNHIVGNIEDYLKENNESYLHSEIDLGLSLLLDDYEKHFRYPIKWDNDVECFYID